MSMTLLGPLVLSLVPLCVALVLLRRRPKDPYKVPRIYEKHEKAYREIRAERDKARTEAALVQDELQTLRGQVINLECALLQSSKALSLKNQEIDRTARQYNDLFERFEESQRTIASYDRENDTVVDWALIDDDDDNVYTDWV